MTTGHAKTLIIHMSGPMEMEMKIDLQQLNVFVGMNGVGKSLVMKLVWVLQMVAQLVVMKSPGLKEGAQYILDNSIPDHDMMAVLILHFESGAMININLLDGKVTNVNHSGMEKIDQPSRCTYMSSEMRTFTSIKQYLTLRKALGVQEMDKHYKLYDVLYIEGLIQRMPITLDKLGRVNMGAVREEGLVSVEFNEDDFVGTWDNGDKKPLSMLGSGSQAMINMTIGALNK